MKVREKDAVKGVMILFVINETEFGWEEIVAAAKAWGEWQPFVAEVHASLACLSHAAEFGQPVTGRAMKDEATAFRYAHNLISAEDTQLWFDRWELTTEQWMSYLRSKLLRKQWADRLDEIVAAHPVSEEEIAAVLKPYAVCTDKLGEWALKLAGHAAIAAKSGSFDTGGQHQRMAPRDLVACVEAEFETARQQTLTPKLIETKIADHRLDWIRFDCRCLWFAEEGIAREAIWCVTEDGLSLDEVALDARSEVRQWDFYLDEIDANIRPHFLAARQGDLLGPLKFRETFPLFSLTEKKMPASDDPQIRQRAEQVIIRGWMDQAINERVKWVN